MQFEASAEQRLERSRQRKKNPEDWLKNRQALVYTSSVLSNPKCAPVAQLLMKKMVLAALVDDFTSPEVIDCIAAHASEMLTAVDKVKDGNGFLQLRRMIDAKKYKSVGTAINTNYTAVVDPEQRSVFWTICAAFFMVYYELQHKRVFCIPLLTDNDSFEKFLIKYPEFLIRTWDARDLFYFHSLMVIAVSLFGNGNNMACLVQFVTFLSKGKFVALTCNTSGGGLKGYDQPTEVSTEKCRILIYQRESGVTPKQRKNKTIVESTQIQEKTWDCSVPIPFNMGPFPGMHIQMQTAAAANGFFAQMWNQSAALGMPVPQPMSWPYGPEFYFSHPSQSPMAFQPFGQFPQQGSAQPSMPQQMPFGGFGYMR